MNNLFFYLPLLYRYHTRERNYFLVPFIMTDFLPPFVLCLTQLNESVFHFLVVFILSYFSMFSIYEIGYIMNDAITIKKEYNPVMRLTETELEYFEKNNFKILAVRFSLFALFNGFLVWCYKYNISYLLLFNVVLLVVYLLHNYFRNGVRFVTDTVLNLGKYFIPLFLFSIDYKSAEFLLYFIFFDSVQ